MRSATNHHSPFHFALLAGLLLLIGVQQAMGDSWIDPPPASMPTPRRLLAAAVYEGKVYTFGGCGSPCFQPPLHTSIVEETTVEVYDPQADPYVNPKACPQSLPWVKKQAMPTILYGAAAAAPGNGRIYTAGGYLSGNVLQEYDPEKNSWRLRRPMPTARYGAAAVALNGKVYVLGGSGPSAALEEYDPATDAWTPRAPMPTARVFLAAAVAGGEIYAIGGSPDCCGGAVTAAVEIYNPATDTWRRGPPLFVAEQVSAAVELDGKIDVFGGFVPGSGVRASTYEYDPDHPALGWAIKAPMPTARDQAPAVALDGRAFVLGGSTDCHCRARADNGGYTPDSRPSPTPSADLAIAIRGAARVSSCTPIQYTIEVTNRGPDPVRGASVSDELVAAPPGLTWTCRASAGAHCAKAGAATERPIADHVDLQAGASVTYTVTAALSATATAGGAVVSLASVRAPAGATDSNPQNDDSRDSEVVDPPNADLEVRVKAPPSVIAGEEVQYTLTVTNRGPCPALETVLTDFTPGPASTPKRECKQDGGGPLACPLGTVDRNAQVDVVIDRKVPCDHAAAAPPLGIASVKSATADPKLGNDEAPIPTAVRVQADYAIEKTGPSTVVAGSGFTYTITVTNGGPSCPSGVLVSDTFPRVLNDVHWCQGTSCTPDQSGDLAATLDLCPQCSASYLAAAVVPSTFLGTFVNTATVEVPFGEDPVTRNNAAPFNTTVLPAPQPCVCPIPTLSDTELLAFALLLALAALVLLRCRPFL